MKRLILIYLRSSVFLYCHFLSYILQRIVIVQRQGSNGEELETKSESLEEDCDYFTAKDKSGSRIIGR